MNFDTLRAQFPPLASGRAYLDNAAGGLLPLRSIAAVTEHLTRYGATNAMPGHAPGREVLALKKRAREGTALFLNADAEDVALGPSTTALTFRLAAAFARLWGPGDEVILSGLEHEANASPWRELERVGVTVRVWHARQPEMRLHPDDLAALLSPRTRLVAVTASSNALGVRVDIPAVTAQVRAAGAWTVVDAVHAAPHAFPDMQAWGADFVAFSPYKVWGPHLGALWVAPQHRARLPWPKLSFVPPGDITGIEYGTPQFELLAGWLGTLDYLRELGGHAVLTRAALEAASAHIAELERPITENLLSGLLNAPGVTVYGPHSTQDRVGTVAFRVEGEAPELTAARLSAEGVDVAAGHFYAVQPLKDLGLYPQGVVRASIAHYTSLEDVELLLEGLMRD
ncbi:cysteine desulfurase-like protein [Deinococcus metallilatus]|uniref:Cysteine desulfurase family protein (TIGR01976 family) n=1 Tax=Deinococcus metallilatus TaxID=1211322 RepID=A0AAJ5F498_9DEIO|nr:cysteine desulfurase-like protein [Deinococcus metallilatus]MBB5295150.1 cysteine desulfurase family protein (TIGR01976 family) [Deinococcus metallilatus]QBY08675.1 cysteine desulfurase-like protein [Deinococcus metallilatus]RXJ10554.1 cysteine desulfurase-like protein [Deinococcus metallilatus]TLK26525.1 cysteine desulfurase-like protein [Deinococcus metallilatus]GMA14923.1 cysteine desulfurase-like protein [Deinococcus metallilatus]